MVEVITFGITEDDEPPKVDVKTFGTTVLTSVDVVLFAMKVDDEPTVTVLLL